MPLINIKFDDGMFDALTIWDLSKPSKSLKKAIETRARELVSALPDGFKESRFETACELIREDNCLFYLSQHEVGELSNQKVDLHKMALNEIQPVLEVWKKFGVVFASGFFRDGWLVARIRFDSPNIEES